ncbi:MAG: hypothetical protein ACOZF0_02575 [Thermodesulfobacteriota bacterium]
MFFPLNEHHCANIHDLFHQEPNAITFEEPLYLEGILFAQQIWDDPAPPGVDIIQQMKVDYVRVVEKLSP